MFVKKFITILYIDNFNIKMNEENEEIFLSEENLHDFGMPKSEDVESEIIFEGGSGTVYKLCQISNPNKCLAIKKIKNEKNPSEIEKFDILKKLNHKNIIKYEICIKEDKIFSMEFCDFDLTSFFDFFAEEYINLEAEKYFNFFKRYFEKIINDTLKGLDYLQNQEILHNDIKLDNIMVKFDNKNKKTFKIGDFGYTQKFREYYRMCGTVGYISPEKFHYHKLKEQIKDNKSDIWSTGIMLFAIYMHYYYNIYNDNATQKGSEDYFDKLEKKQTPNTNKTLEDVLCGTSCIVKEIINFIEKNIENEEYKNLLKGMLKIDPKNRKTARECLEQFKEDKNEQNGGCYLSM